MQQKLVYNEYGNDTKVQEKLWFYRWTTVVTTVFMILTIIALTIYLLLAFDIFVANKLKTINIVSLSPKTIASTTRQSGMFYINFNIPSE